MSPKIVDKEKRRQEILLAAFEAFSKKGYYETTLSEIARSAGMGQGTLYYYFPTKEEIFWGVHAMLMAEVGEWIQARIREAEEPVERLKVLLNLMFQNFPEAGFFDDSIDEEEERFGQTIGGFSLVMMEFWIQAERSGKQEEFYRHVEEHITGLRGLIVELMSDVGTALPSGLEQPMAAHMLLALRDGLSMHLRIGGLPKDSLWLGQVRDVLIERLLSAAKNPSSEEPSSSR